MPGVPRIIQEILKACENLDAQSKVHAELGGPWADVFEVIQHHTQAMALDLKPILDVHQAALNAEAVERRLTKDAADEIVTASMPKAITSVMPPARGSY